MTPPRYAIDKAFKEINEVMNRADVSNNAFTHIFGEPEIHEDNYPEDTSERLAEYRAEEAEHLRDCQEDR